MEAVDLGSSCVVFNGLQVNTDVVTFNLVLVGSISVTLMHCYKVLVI
jgi:hypothetical protein